MSVTVTLHLWWVLAYLAAGVVTFMPLNWWALQHLARPRPTFWQEMRRTMHRPKAVAVQIVAWPLAFWEVAR